VNIRPRLIRRAATPCYLRDRNHDLELATYDERLSAAAIALNIPSISA
jgi:hypothetical protein